MEKEIRSNSISGNGESRTVFGYAVVWDSESRDLGFIETIKKGAITEDVIKNSNVIAKFNHMEDSILARSKFGEGTLKLTLDDYGLKYEFEAPHTAAGDELLEMVRRGDLYEASFAFTVSKEEGSEKWYQKNGVLYRDIYKIDELFDISPVITAAYAATSACTRKIDEIKSLNEKLEAEYKLLEDELFDGIRL